MQVAQSSDGFTDASCAPEGYCVAISGLGYFLETSSATGGAGAWQQYSSNSARGLSCPVAKFCVAIEPATGVTNAAYRHDIRQAGGFTGWDSDNAPAWTGTASNEAFAGTVACLSDTACLLGDQHGRIVVGTIRTPVALGPATLTLQTDPDFPGKYALDCRASWVNNPVGTDGVVWTRDGIAWAPADPDNDPIVDGAAEGGHTFVCTISTHNSAGSASATSSAVTIPGGGTPTATPTPAPTATPAAPGSTPAPSASSTPTPVPVPSPKAPLKLQLPVSLKVSSLGKGLTVPVTNVPAKAKIVVTISVGKKTLATSKATASKSGKAGVKIKLSKKAQRKAKGKKVTLRVTANGMLVASGKLKVT